MKFLAKNSNCTKHAQFDGGLGNAERVCYDAVGLFFDQTELDDGAEARRKRRERGTDGSVGFSLFSCVRSRIRGKIVRKLDVNARFAQMIEGGVCGDAAEPGLEIAVGPEAGMGSIGA